MSNRRIVVLEKSDSVEARRFDREHHVPDVAEVEPRVALDHDPGVGLAACGRAETFAELIGRQEPVVDPQTAALVDRDADRLALSLLERLGRLGQFDLRPLPELRRHDHEDDQQHQHHVHEGRDVDLSYGIFLLSVQVRERHRGLRRAARRG